MDVRSLSNDQLKDLKKQINRASRKFFFFKRVTQTADGVSVDCINTELKRRKIQKLKLGEQKKY